MIIRYNAFKQIHKGLRAYMYDTALHIQHTDFTDSAATSILFKKIENLLWLFEGHAEVEDNIVFPIIQRVAPEVVADFESQHVRDHELSQAVAYWINMYKIAATDEERIMTGIKLLNEFNEFVAFNLQHMNKEETIVNQVIWENYSDKELLGLTQEIVKNIPRDKDPHYTRWMIAGNGNHELIQWFNAVKANAPSFVFDELISLAQETLPAERWQAVNKAVLAELAA